MKNLFYKYQNTKFKRLCLSLVIWLLGFYSMYLPAPFEHASTTSMMIVVWLLWLFGGMMCAGAYTLTPSVVEDFFKDDLKD